MTQGMIEPADIERHLAKGGRSFRFEPALEAAFEKNTRRHRARVVRSTILPSIVTYNLFLVADALLVPQTFWLAVLLHLGVVTPLLLGVGWVMSREPTLMVRETLAASLPVLMVGQIMLIHALNETSGSDQYQYLAIIVLVYMNVNQRLDFRFAAGASTLLVATHLAVLLPGHSPFAVKLIGSTFMVAAAYLTLHANRRMERDGRYAFLRGLQDQAQRGKAERAAGRDSLTGLSNRRRLDERTAEIWGSFDRSDASVAMVMIDVDHFKSFNDRYGHPAGDLCLKQIAGAISAGLRDENDLAVRFGGEEFLVLLAHTGIAEAIRRAVEACAIPHEATGPGGTVTVSLGVLAGPVRMHQAGELIAGADGALYAAKRNGRNQVWPPSASSAIPMAPRLAIVA